MTNYDNNQSQQRLKINKWVLVLLAFGAAALVFFFGYLFRGVIAPPQERPNRNQNTAYTNLYNFIEQHHHKDIDDSKAFVMQLESIINSLDDPYTSLLLTSTISGPQGMVEEDKEKFEGVGIVFTYQDFKAVINDVMRHSPAEEAGIYPGDKIVGIVEDGAEIYFKVAKYDQVAVVAKLKGVAGDSKTFIVERPDESIVQKTIIYAKFDRPTVISKKLNEDFGYIKLTEFAEHSDEVFIEHLEKLESSVLTDESKTLIIDLRDNPGGYLDTVTTIMKKLIVKDTTKSYVIGIKPTKTGAASYHYGGLEEKKPYDIKVLVNENSASASEVLAAALHYSGGYEVYGESTFGKNVYQTTVTFDLTPTVKAVLKYTQGHWVYGDENGSNNILDKNTNPIPLTKVKPEKYLTFKAPIYKEEVKLDMVSEELVNVQKFLNAKYNLTLREDGYFDVATQNAITTFQTEFDIDKTGTYNLETMQTIYTDYHNMLDDHTYDNQIDYIMNLWK